jgi:PIN domain nuclease of toxin-antitoxin system
LHEWLDLVERLPVLQFIPVDNPIARLSVELPGEFHPDPADRITAFSTQINVPRSQHQIIILLINIEQRD